MTDPEQDGNFTQFVQLFLTGDQPKKMQEYLIESGVNESEFPGKEMYICGNFFY